MIDLYRHGVVVLVPPQAQQMRSRKTIVWIGKSIYVYLFRMSAVCIGRPQRLWSHFAVELEMHLEVRSGIYFVEVKYADVRGPILAVRWISPKPQQAYMGSPPSPPAHQKRCSSCAKEKAIEEFSGKKFARVVNLDLPRRLRSGLATCDPCRVHKRFKCAAKQSDQR